MKSRHADRRHGGLGTRVSVSLRRRRSRHQPAPRSVRRRVSTPRSGRRCSHPCSHARVALTRA